MRKNYMKGMLLLVCLLLSSGMIAQKKVFTEGFENAFPGTWTQEQVEGTKMYEWQLQSGDNLQYPDGAHTGKGRAYFFSPANSPETVRLVSEVFDASFLLDDSQLRFYYALPAFGGSQDKNDTLRVYWRNTPDGKWYKFEKEFTGKQDFWTEAVVPLLFPSATFQLAFEAKTAGGRGVLLDDIVVMNAPQCGEAVSGLRAMKVTSMSSTLTWGRASDIATYDLKIATEQITDFETQTAWKDVTGLTENIYSLDGLSPETTYYYYLRSDCGDGDVSPWTEATFVTDYAPVESFDEGFEDYPKENQGSNQANPNNPIKGVWKGFEQDMEKATGGYGPYVYNSAANAATGDCSIQMYAYHTITDGTSRYSRIYLVSPEVSETVDWKTKQIRFKMMCSNVYGKVYVGMATHPDALNYSDGEFEELAVFDNYHANSYEEKILPLNNYEGNGRYIVFYVSGLDTKSSTNYYLDDIVLGDIATDCGEMQMPTPQAESITATGATLKWNDLGVTAWNVKVSTSDIDPETTYGDVFTEVVEATPSCTVSGLSGGMAYYAYVQPICADGVEGKWSRACVFFTETASAGISVPYFQNFDAEYKQSPTSSGPSTPFPRAWERTSSVSTTNAEPLIYTTYYSAPGALRVRYSGSGKTQYSIFTLPKFTADLKDLQVRCKVKAGSATYHLYLIVGVTNDNNVTKETYQNYTLVDTLHVSGTEWEEVVVKFDQYKGAGGYIVFLTPEDMAQLSSQQSVYIDDLYVEEIGGADRPSDFTGELTDNSTVNLSWKSDATKFEVVYGNEGLSLSDPARQTQMVTGTTTSVGGLLSNKTYDFYVRVKEDDGTLSSWTGPISFTTLQTATTLPYETGFEHSEDNSQWTFLNETFINRWRIGTATKKEGNHAMYVSMPTNDNSYASGSPQPYLFAYRVIDMQEAGLYDIGFSWKAQGEGTADFMRVFIVPDSLTIEPAKANGITATATPAGWRTLGGKYNLQKEWQDVVFSREMFVEAGKYKLLFYWTNNTTTNTSYPPAAAIDSIFFKKNLSCMSPVDVRVDKINDVDAELNFIGYNTEVWDLKLTTQEIKVANDKIADETADTYDGQITEMSHRMINLLPSTTYYYYLRTPCNDEWMKGSFTTKCERQPLTVTEFFDENGTGTAAFPDCWTKLTDNTTTATKDYPYIGTTHYNGVGALDLYATGSTYNVAVSPMLNVADLSKVQIRLQGYASNAAAKLYVGAIVDAADRTTFFPIDTLTVETVNEWEYFEVPFDRYAGMGDAKYIALMSEKNTNHFLVDSVVIEPIPACRTPRELTAAEDAYSATLSWNGYGAGAFQVKVSETPIDPYTEAGTVFDSRVEGTTKVVEKLRPLTRYYWYVQAECAPDSKGEWSKETYFETLCPYYSLPLRESFDTSGTGSGVVPECWNVVKSYTKSSTLYPYIYTASTPSLQQYIKTLPGALYFNDGTEKNYQLITTPRLHVDDISSLHVTFSGYIKNKAGFLLVGVMTDPTDISTFVPVGKAEYQGSDYQDYDIDLSSYQGDGKYVAFSNFNETSNNEVYIDNIVISDPNMSCPMPVNLQVLRVTDQTASVRWNITGDTYDSFNLKLSTRSIVPDMEDGDVKNETGLTERNVSLVDLKPNTTYYVYVQTVCDDGSSYWEKVSFETRCGAVETYQEDFSAIEKGTDMTELCWSSYVRVLTGNPAASKLVYPNVNNGGTSAEPNMALELAPYYYSSTISGNETTEVYAISPLISNLAAKQLTFRYRSFYTSRNFQLIVGVMSDWGDLSTFVPVDTLYSNGTSTWYQHLMNFSEYPTAKFVAFKLATDEAEFATSNKSYIDDIVLDDIPACAAPYDVRVAEVKSDAITFAWKAGNVASSSWNYVLTDQAVDLSLENATDLLAEYQVKAGNVGTPTCTLDGLTADTEYWFYVTSSCGDTYFPQGLQVRTECNMKLSVPYYEDFSSYGTATGIYSAFPNCWYRVSNYYGTARPNIDVAPSAMKEAVSGNVLYFYTDKTYAWAITPEIETEDITRLRARFKLGTTAAASARPKYEFYVGIMSSLRDTATFVPIDTIRFDASNIMYEVKVPFESYTGTGKHLAFKVTDPTKVYLAELNIEEDTSCELPGQVRVVNTTDSTLTIAWDKMGNSSWEVRYGLKGFDINEPSAYTAEVVTDSFYVAKKLQELTDYDVYVRGVCGEGDHSPWIRPLTLRTTQKPLSIPFATDFEDSAKDKIWQVVSEKSGDFIPLWAIGNATATHEGGRSMYLSLDGGITSSYEQVTSRSGIFAYTTLELPEGMYDISFRWKGTGDGNNAFMSAFLVADSVKLENGMHDYSLTGRKDTITVISGLSMADKDNLAWEQFTGKVKIRNSQAGIYKFSFYCENSDKGGVPFAVDDLSIVYTAPTTPEYLRMEGVGEQSVTFDWLGYNAEYYEVKIFDKPVELDQVGAASDYVKEENVYTLPAKITGLQSGTQYYMYVKADEGTEWVGMPFATLCSAATLNFPKIETFETEGFGYNASFPGCWTKLNTLTKYQAETMSDYDLRKYYIPYVADSVKQNGYYDNLGYESDGALLIGGSRSPKYNSMLISTEFAPEVLQNIHLQFRLRHVSASSSRLIFGVMTDPTDIATFTPLDSIQNLGNGWSLQTVSLRDYDLSGLQAKYVALMPSNSVGSELLIDNLRLGRWEDYDVSDQICKGYPYRRHGFDIPAGQLSETGTKVFSRQALRPAGTMGNDSIINLHLTIGESLYTYLEAEICKGDVYTENGFKESEPGEHRQVYPSVNGCDSIVILDLKVNETYLFRESQISCPDQLPYVWHGQELTETAVYYDSLLTVNTLCDSVYVIDFKVATLQETKLTADICAAELPYDFHGKPLSVGGTYTDTLSNVNGCDSVILLTLNVHQAYDLIERVTICEGGSFSGFGFDNITKAGEYTHGMKQSIFGCDSIFTLKVTVATELASLQRDSICKGDAYDPGSDFAKIGETETEILYSKTIPSQVVASCDSTVTLIVSKLPTYDVNEAVDISEADLPFHYADTLFDVGTVSGDYRIMSKTEFGCDSIINLTLTVGGSGIGSVKDGLFSIIPNPINVGMPAFISYDFSEAEKEDLLVEIFNSVGTRIQMFFPKEYPINVGKYLYGPGVYVVRITTGTKEVLIGRIVAR